MQLKEILSSTIFGKSLWLLLSILNLTLGTIAASKFVSQTKTMIIVLIIMLLLPIVSLMNQVPFLKEINAVKEFIFFKIFYAIETVASIFGFFILLSNYCVSEKGFKNCSSCEIMTDSRIIFFTSYIIVYIVVWVLATIIKKRIFSKKQ